MVAGDFTVTVRSPADTAESTPSVVESATAGGLYYFDIPASFTLTNGVGNYGVTIEITTSPLDLGGESVLFEANMLDDIAADAALARKMLTNKQTGADGSPGTLVTLDDDSIATLLTQNITSKTGGAVTIDPNAPAIRTKGV